MERIVSRFAGADFDGMQDLKTSVRADYVQADGSVQSVHHGADFVFCAHRFTDGWDVLVKRAYDLLMNGREPRDWQEQQGMEKWARDIVGALDWRIGPRTVEEALESWRKEQQGARGGAS